MPVGALADRHRVASQLTGLAHEPGLAARRDELTALADALRGLGDGDLEPWTELDLLGAFARRESVHRPLRPLPAYLGRLETVLGVLVFVPLLLTWSGLALATRAYEALLRTDPAQASRPFLQLWQTGFDGRLTGWLAFGHVVETAAVAIAVLMALALVHGGRRAAAERAEADARHAQERLLAQMVPILTRAQLLLNEERLSSPGRFAAELGTSAGTLHRLSAKVLKVQESLERTAEQVGKTVETSDRRLASLDATVKPLERVSTRIEKAVRDSGTGVNQALGEVRAASVEVGDHLERAGERVEQAITVLAASQRSFTTSTEVVADVTGQTLRRLGEVAEQTALAVATSQEAARRLAEQTDALRAAAERFTELDAALRSTQAPAPAPARTPAPAAEPSRSAHSGRLEPTDAHSAAADPR
jgi:hypothetical protein